MFFTLRKIIHMQPFLLIQPQVILIRVHIHSVGKLFFQTFFNKQTTTFISFMGKS